MLNVIYLCQQGLFVSVQPSARTKIWKFNIFTKVCKNQFQFQFIMSCFLFTDSKSPHAAPFFLGYFHKFVFSVIYIAYLGVMPLTSITKMC